MASEMTSSVSYGSDDTARERKKLYMLAAKKREGGNFSRFIMRIVDKELGITLPLPITGRPKKLDKPTSSEKKNARRPRRK